MRAGVSVSTRIATALVDGYPRAVLMQSTEQPTFELRPPLADAWPTPGVAKAAMRRMRTAVKLRMAIQPPCRRRITVAYSGMFPCFRLGVSTRLVCSVSSARISFGRVSWGMITSSM
jgi:hypothetical protein